MDKQTTPVHIRLWHKEFWFMSISGLLLSASFYALVPVMVRWLLDECEMATTQVVVIMGIAGIGILMPGCLTSFLVQRYRRNKMCLYCIFLLLASFIALLYICDHDGLKHSFLLLCVVRLIQGAAYGEARMILGSTLIIDTCESFQRTAANHAATWLARFGSALGPAVAMMTQGVNQFETVVILSSAMCIASYLLIAIVKFPFKAPEESYYRFSLDRFWLNRSLRLAINLLPIAIVLGLVIASAQELRFYSMMTCGFFIALLAQRFLFVSSEPKSEIVSGLILIIAAMMVVMNRQQGPSMNFSAILFGCGIGLTFSRFLLNIIKMSDHCQRGTAQSSFFLTCEVGIIMGISFYAALFIDHDKKLAATAVCLAVIALFLYVVYTNKWFLNNKQR